MSFEPFVVHVKVCEPEYEYVVVAPALPAPAIDTSEKTARDSSNDRRRQKHPVSIRVFIKVIEIVKFQIPEMILSTPDENSEMLVRLQNLTTQFILRSGRNVL
jgi:hypothetical protein